MSNSPLDGVTQSVIDFVTSAASIVARLLKRFGSWVLAMDIEPRNIHHEKEAEPVTCLACGKRAMLLFNDNDVLMVVCRDQKRCQYTEVV